MAEAYIAQLKAANVFGKPIVTEVTKLNGFDPAEAYHQHFVQMHPDHPYVVVNALPKIEKTRKLFAGMVKR